MYKCEVKSTSHFLFFGALLVFAGPSHAQSSATPSIDPVCSEFPAQNRPAIAVADLINLTNSVIVEKFAENYPEMKNLSWRFQDNLNTEQYQIQANLNLLTLFKSAIDREYEIQYNPYLLAHPPSTQALRGILTHELFHVVDMLDRNSLQSIIFGIGYETHDHSQYERQTDLRAMEAGEAEGLIEYRCWIYRLLNARELTTKKYIYYTPTEIRAWEAEWVHPIPIKN